MTRVSGSLRSRSLDRSALPARMGFNLPSNGQDKRTGTFSESAAIVAIIPTFVLVGPLALLATLFPALFGGLALFLRRWLVLLAIASLESTLYVVHAWF